MSDAAGPPGPRIAVRITACTVLAAAVTGLVAAVVPHRLVGRTSIVGYPIFADFNIATYDHTYELLAIFFPVAAVVLYDLACRLERRRAGTGRGPRAGRLPPPMARDAPPAALTGHKVVVVGIARTAVVGLVLGLEAGEWARPGPGGFWLVVVAASAGYTLAVTGLSARGAGRRIGSPRRPRLPRWDAQALINAVVAPFCVLGLYAVSSVTGVTVTATHTRATYPWLPLWLALGLTALLLAWVVRRIRTGRGRPEAIRALEYAAVSRIAGFVLVFLLTSHIAGALGHADLFHEGESLGGANLLRSGLFPWRDFYFIHGPLDDLLYALAGFRIFGYSRWGAQAGQFVLLFPLDWACLYLAYTFLFRRNWPFLLLIPLFLYGPDIDFRFIPVPLVVVLFGAYLRRPSAWLGAAFGAVLVVVAILTPETLPFGGAIAAALALHNVYYRPPGRLIQALRPTLWAAAGAAGAAGVWAAYLAAHGALGAFVGYFILFSSGRRLAIGIPIAVTGPAFVAAMVVPVLALAGFFLFFVTQVRRARPLTADDWAMAALAGFLAYYVTKFLERADSGHLFEVLGVSLPLIAYVIFRAAGGLEAAMRDHAWGRRAAAVTEHPVGVLTLAVMLVAVVPHAVVAATVRSLPRRVSGVAAQAPTLDRLGYATPDAVDQSALADLRQVLDVAAPPGAPVFDFTNSPAVFYFLFNRPTPTRYYDVQMANQAGAQQDLVRELDRSRPPIVIWDGPVGLPSWDGVPNPVRHYLVSDYVFAHYQPLANVRGFSLLRRNDLTLAPDWQAGLHLDQPIATTGIDFPPGPCDWGYAPGFLQVPNPPSPSDAIPLAIAPGASPTSVAVTLPPAPTTFHWLEVDSTAGLGADTFTLTDGSGAPGHAISFRTRDDHPHQVRIQVGSCQQWHSYPATTLTVSSAHPETISAVRVLP